MTSKCDASSLNINSQIVSTALVVQAQGNQVGLLSCDQDIIASELFTIVW
jgi:hypothetical protein